MLVNFEKIIVKNMELIGRSRTQKTRNSTTTFCGSSSSSSPPYLIFRVFWNRTFGSRLNDVVWCISALPAVSRLQTSNPTLSSLRCRCTGLLLRGLVSRFSLFTPVSIISVLCIISSPGISIMFIGKYNLIDDRLL